MITLRQLTECLEQIAPPAYQESYDNSGLITGHPDMPVKGVLVCLDSTEAVIREAVARGCNVVVAHHPIIFNGLKRITGRDYVERTVIEAIRNEIAIYAIHTNLDNVYAQGVNSRIARRLGLVNTRILAPKPGLDGQVGSGMIGDLEPEIPEQTFLQHLKTRMSATIVRHTRLLDRPVRRIAVCGGSGSFLLKDAISQGAGFFVTADYKYHQFFDAEDKIVIADIGHYESEQFTIELLGDIITQKFSNFAVHLTKTNTNPVFYF